MKKLIAIITLTFTFTFTSFGQMGLWIRKWDLPANGRSAACGFNLGTAAYVSCGIDSGGYKRSTFLYNPSNDSWTQMQSLGGLTGSGLGRDVAMCFSFATTAYVVGGQGSIAYMSDTWKYDGASDTWSQVQTFNGGGRRSGVGFAINGKGYVALGQASTGLKNDCWEYNPSTNIWTQKALFPGTARRLSSVFVINNIAYVGTGDDGICKADMYAYDPSGNSWTPKASFSGTPRYGAVGFAVNGKGYIGFGYDNTLQNRRDFYEYDPVGNSWTTMNSFPGTARSNAVAVTCPNNKVYMGLGYDSLYRSDWWEFNPLLNSVEEVLSDETVNLFPCPMSDHSTLQLDASVLGLNKEVVLRIYDLNGKLLRDEKVKSEQTVINRGDLSSGVYLVNVSAGSGSFTKRLLVE